MKKIILLLLGFITAIQIFAQPVINSFSPVSGPIGTTVTVYGSGFSSVPAGNIVYFGAVKAVVLKATDSVLAVTVPVGATYHPITVTTNKLTAYSINSFNITFSGDGSEITPTSFLPKKDITTGIYPHSVAMADFDGDGRAELLVSKGSSGTVSILKNSSSTTGIAFGSKLEVTALGNSHEGSAIGDLDGDGKIDFVVANNFNTSSISIFRNTSTEGNISFAPKIDYPADNGPYLVAIGELNGDGKPDLAIANNGGNVVSVYINTSITGQISFASKIDLPTGTNPYGIAIADFNDDGKADLAVTTQGSSSSLSVMKNTTTGNIISFDATVDYFTAHGFFNVTVSDLDSDNKPDLLAVCAFSNSVIFLKNTSTAENLSFGAKLNIATGNYPNCVAVGDIDGDGKPDLVTANNSQHTVSVVKNTSAGGDISFSTPVNFAVGTHPNYVAIGDLDGDSRPDIAVANSSDDAVSILRNIISADIAPAIKSFTPATGINGTTVEITGSNFTGSTSVKFGGVEAASFIVHSATQITAIVGAGGSGDVSVTTANGTVSQPGFSFNGPIIAAFTPTTAVAGTIVTIKGSNFNNVTDVKFGQTSALTYTVNSLTSITATVGSGSSGDVTVITPNGKAVSAGFTFGVPTITSFAPASGSAGSAVIITGTNFSEVASENIVFFGAVKATVSAATPTHLHVIVPAGATYLPISVTTNHLTAYSATPFIVTFAGDTTNVSSHSFSISGNYATGTYPSVVLTSDLNNDGKPDLISINGGSNSISVLKNTSTAAKISFNTKKDYNTGSGPSRVSIGDLDGDGKKDIVVTNLNEGNASTVSVFINRSTPDTILFGTKTDLVTGNGSNGTAIYDMNGDGKPDLVVSSPNSAILSVFQNTTSLPGSVSFGDKKDYTLYGHADNIAIADLDRDGKADMITANSSDGTISIFRNNSSEGKLSFEQKLDFLAGSYMSYITTGDLDGDGKLDVITADYKSHTLLFYKNYSTPGTISLGVMEQYKKDAKNIEIADLDGDGKLDLCTGTYNTGIVSVIQNTYAGSNNFSFAPNVDFSIGVYDTYAAVCDLDLDGEPEIAVANSLANTIAILKAGSTSNQPVITSSSIISAGKGETVSLFGSNFTGVTSVAFGGVLAASFSVVSAGEIRAVVGEGASGDITVTTLSGSVSLAGFKFIPHIITNGSATICKVGSVTLISTASANNQWFKDGLLITGATSDTLIVQLPGRYTVQTTANGISTFSDNNVAVTVVVVPDPYITKDANNNLLSSAVSGNQWFLDGNLIPGASYQMYHPTQSGNYTVKDTAKGCISDPSTPYNIQLSGVIDLGNGQYINAYPNPVRNSLSLNWNISGTADLNVDIIDLQGKKWLSLQNVSNATHLDLSKLPPGIYLAKVFDSQHKINYTIRIVKES